MNRDTGEAEGHLDDKKTQEEQQAAHVVSSQSSWHPQRSFTLAGHRAGEVRFQQVFLT
jgi:hypothetical protein